MSKTATELLDFQNPVFKTLLYWGSLLLLKTLGMSILTAVHRFKNLTFANPEDATIKNAKVKFDHPDIERIRRAHRNDLENVFPIILASIFYILTDPSAFLASMLIRIAVIGRFVHTISYVLEKQPARGLGFGIPFAITIYMSVVSVLHFC